MTTSSPAINIYSRHEASVEAAMDLALTRGLHCFPCGADKSPTCPGGFKAASNDPAQIRELFYRYPGSLIGVRTGEASSVAVLDLDAGKGGEEWCRDHRDILTETRTIRTRSGGLHLWFRHRSGLRCSAGTIADGVDVRADGGYILMWERAGFPILREGPIADWPLSLMPSPKVFGVTSTTPLRIPDDKIIHGLIRTVAMASEGQRNKLAFWAACRAGEAVRTGVISEAIAMAVITEAAIHAGLSVTEARKTVTSGILNGLMGGANG